MDFSSLQNGETFPYNGHVSLIEILEWFGCRSARNAFVNQLAHVFALLKSHLSDSRQRYAIPVERCRVPNDKNLRVSWTAEVGLHAHAACSIGIHVEPLACGRGCNARRPDNRFADDTFTRDGDAVGINVVNAVTKTNFNAQSLIPLVSAFGKFLETLRQTS